MEGIRRIIIIPGSSTPRAVAVLRELFAKVYPFQKALTQRIFGLCEAVAEGGESAEGLRGVGYTSLPIQDLVQRQASIGIVGEVKILMSLGFLF